MYRTLSLVATLSLALVACSGADDGSGPAAGTSEDTSMSAPGASVDGVYRGEVNGTVVEVTFPVDHLNPDAVAIRKHSADVAFEEPVTFALRTITNNNDEAVSGCPPRIVTDTGETIAFEFGWSFVGSLRDSIPDENVELINEGVDLYNQLIEGGEMLPGSITTEIFVTTGDVPAGGQFFSGAYTMDSLGQGCDTKLTL